MLVVPFVLGFLSDDFAWLLLVQASRSLALAFSEAIFYKLKNCNEEGTLRKGFYGKSASFNGWQPKEYVRSKWVEKESSFCVAERIPKNILALGISLCCLVF